MSVITNRQTLEKQIPMRQRKRARSMRSNPLKVEKNLPMVGRRRHYTKTRASPSLGLTQVTFHSTTERDLAKLLEVIVSRPSHNKSCCVDQNFAQIWCLIFFA